MRPFSFTRHFQLFSTVPFIHYLRVATTSARDLTKTSIEICVTAAAAAAATTLKLIFRAISLKCTHVYGIGSFMPPHRTANCNFQINKLYYYLSRTITSLMATKIYRFVSYHYFFFVETTHLKYLCVCAVR